MCILARLRSAQLGYINIDIRIGEGTRGWPEATPFDAIIVSAAGKAVPEALKQQLTLGGRLIIPVGDFEQSLLKITRRGQQEFDTEDFGTVLFAPLVASSAKTEA